jgi:hypothetical protein
MTDNEQNSHRLPLGNMTIIIRTDEKANHIELSFLNQGDHVKKLELLLNFFVGLGLDIGACRFECPGRGR